MSDPIYLYYALMVICFAVSLFYLRFVLVRWLAALLLSSIITESVVQVIGTGDSDHYLVYHFYIPVEYTLATLALRSQITRQWLRKTMLASLAVYWLAWLYIRFFVQSLSAFPGMSIGMEAVLIIAWSVLSLIYIEPVSELSIFRLPVFWICLGFLVYFSSTVALSTFYNYLLDSQTARAKYLFNLIVNISNCLLYIFLTIGILCHKGQRKFSVP